MRKASNICLNVNRVRFTYVRTSDLSHPKFETPQDALEWQKTQPDSYYIPLYDFQGNEIGSFLRERNNLTIAEMEAMKG